VEQSTREHPKTSDFVFLHANKWQCASWAESHGCCCHEIPLTEGQPATGKRWRKGILKPPVEIEQENFVSENVQYQPCSDEATEHLGDPLRTRREIRGAKPQVLEKLKRYIQLRQKRSRKAPATCQVEATQHEKEILDKYHFCENIVGDDNGSHSWESWHSKKDTAAHLKMAEALIYTQIPVPAVYEYLMKDIFGATRFHLSAIVDMSTEQLSIQIKGCFKRYATEHNKSVFANWPYRSLQGGKRHRVLANLIIVLAEKAESIWNQLWEVREKAIQQGDSDKEASHAVLDKLARSGLPATRHWSAFLALDRLVALGIPCPYNSAAYCFIGPGAKKALYKLYPGFKGHDLHDLLIQLCDHVPAHILGHKRANQWNIRCLEHVLCEFQKFHMGVEFLSSGGEKGMLPRRKRKSFHG